MTKIAYTGLIAYLGSDGKVDSLTLEDVSISGPQYLGSVVGYNDGGTNSNATQVTGSWTTDIVDTMSTAISSYGWKYVYNSGNPPTLTKIE